MMELNKIYNMDCFQGMDLLPDKSIDLVMLDPPYNIGKDTWDTIEDYESWLQRMIITCSRVLKDNGSLYIWHNQFPVMAKIQVFIEQSSTGLSFKNMITWEKYQTNKQYYGRTVLMGINNRHKRSYYPMAEYCLFYTKQSKNGMMIFSGELVYSARDYIRSEIIRAKGKIVLKEVNEALGTASNGGGVASACLSLDKAEPAMMTKENYEALRLWLNEGVVGREYEFLRREYEFLRREYEDLRKEYQDFIYPFNFVKEDITTTWLFPPDKKRGHLTPKNSDVIRLMILHSTNPGMVVLDPCMGSGTTAEVCKQTGRQFIGFESNPNYIKIAEERLKQQVLVAN